MKRFRSCVAAIVLVAGFAVPAGAAPVPPPVIGPDRSFACENLAPGQYAVWAVTRPPAKHGFGAIGVGLAKDKTVNIVL